MSWWAWMIGGVILLGAELAFVDAQFYLVFVGTAAIIVGIVVTFVQLDQWVQWALFALLTIGAMVFFRGRIYRRLRGHLPVVRMGPSGDVLTLPVALAPGESCRTEHCGSFWTVRNDSEVPIPSGANVRIARVQGLTLLVHPAV
jgi:membrane protein implicated in regulation of membrane protease activity